MAYAALLSLSQTLDNILGHDPYLLLFEKETLVSLHKTVNALLTFVEEYWHKFRGVVNPLESRIIFAAHQAEDLIEYHIDESINPDEVINPIDTDEIVLYSSKGWLEAKRMPEVIEPEFQYVSLQNVLRDVDSILEEAVMTKNNNPVENIPLPNYSTDTSSDINTTVLEDNFTAIKQRIYNISCNSVDVIPIVGMGGIGKSTLARKLYDDSAKRGYFDRCIWVVVSQDYSLQKLLSEIVLSMGKAATGDLRQVIHQELYGRRYLVVVDDLWSKKAWDDLNVILPKDTAGSRVLVTTRLSEVASYVGSSSNSSHEIQLMNEYQSWVLFDERVFGEGFSCPSELKQIGKKLVESCRGLPLTIVVIAGLLKGNTTKEYWENISENISSSEPTIALRCSKVLSLSYNHLPLYLRPCFLYVTAFPEDYVIGVAKLIRLWMAEGFVEPSGSKLLEEVAEGYLHDLVGRSLFMVSKKHKYNGRIKSIMVHDVLRDFGTSTHFHHELNPEHSRVIMYNKTSFDLLLNFRKPATRSFLMPRPVDGEYSFENLRLLRVLDAPCTAMEGDARKLVHLRYLSIYSLDMTFLEPRCHEFRNIQTLIVNIEPEWYDVIPLQLWKSPSLRHLIVQSDHYSLEHPDDQDGISEETSLQTIRTVTNLRFTKKVLEMVQNLRELKVCYNEEVIARESSNLVHLQKLEQLKIKFERCTFTVSVSDLAFPKSLKKLCLRETFGSWKDMSMVGSLPNLEVLILNRFEPKVGDGWEPIEGQFLKLKLLKLYYAALDFWEAEREHFPSLEILILKNIRDYRHNYKSKLKEIPNGIGEIDTLRYIKLKDCSRSIVDSAKQIQAYQWEMGNQDFQLICDRQKIRPEGY